MPALGGRPAALLLVTALTAATALGAAAPVRPQTPPQTPADEPASTFYSTATVRERPLSSATGSVTVLDRAAIAASGARTVADLLRFVPGLDVTSERHPRRLHDGRDPRRRSQLHPRPPRRRAAQRLHLPGGGRLRPRRTAGLRRRAHRGGARPPLLVLRLDRPLRGDQHPHPHGETTGRRPSSSRPWRATPRSARRRAPSPAPSARPPTSWAAPGSRSSTGWRRSASAQSNLHANLAVPFERRPLAGEDPLRHLERRRLSRRLGGPALRLGGAAPLRPPGGLRWAPISPSEAPAETATGSASPSTGRTATPTARRSSRRCRRRSRPPATPWGAPAGRRPSTRGPSALERRRRRRAGARGERQRAPAAARIRRPGRSATTRSCAPSPAPTRS